MANIASNEALIKFIDNISEEEYELFINEFKEEFQLWNSPEIVSNMVQLSYGSRWHECPVILQLFANKYNCIIIGVVHDFACQYVNHFKIEKL